MINEMVLSPKITICHEMSQNITIRHKMSPCFIERFFVTFHDVNPLKFDVMKNLSIIFQFNMLTFNDMSCHDVVSLIQGGKYCIEKLHENYVTS